MFVPKTIDGWKISFSESENSWEERHDCLFRRETGMWVKKYFDKENGFEYENLEGNYFVFVFIGYIGKSFSTSSYDHSYKEKLSSQFSSIPNYYEKGWAGISFAFEELDKALEFMEVVKEYIKKETEMEKHASA